MLFLVVTNTRDLTTDLVVEELHRGRHPYIRLNCDNLDTVHPTFTFETGEPSFSFNNKGELVDVSNVTAAYLRRPHLDKMIDPKSPDARYLFSEWRALLDGIYSDLSAQK